ncbi:MAG: potassium channel family protein [Candidatus Levyibacteriota bacterium]
MIDALYFSVVSVTSVGYGDFHPTHTITKVFTMLYILSGVGVLLYIVSSITHYIITRSERELEELEGNTLENTIKKLERVAKRLDRQHRKLQLKK